MFPLPNLQDRCYKQLFWNYNIFISLLKDILHDPNTIDINPHNIRRNRPDLLCTELFYKHRIIIPDILYRLKLKNSHLNYVYYLVESRFHNCLSISDLMNDYLHGLDCNKERFKIGVSEEKNVHSTLPIVIYNGRLPWKGDRDTYDLEVTDYYFSTPDTLKKRYLFVDITKIDLNTIPDDSLVRPLIMIEQATSSELLYQGILAAIKIYKGRYKSATSSIIDLVTYSKYLKKYMNGEIYIKHYWISIIYLYPTLRLYFSLLIKSTQNDEE